MKCGMTKKWKALSLSTMLGASVLCANVVPSAVLGAAAALFYAEKVWAVEAGAYLVTVSPSYTDPETGKVEDPGNNEAIGQGMTKKLCGPRGLLEVDSSGNMYLTVRYYLSQFVSDVSFEERNGGSYSSCSYEKMQVKDPVSGSDNLDDKYGYTDYRIPIQSLDSVFRGKAYIEPMGRSVVYFFQASGPVAGSGDFVTSIRTDVPVETEPEVREERRAADERVETDWDRDEGLQEPDEEREIVVSGRETETENRSQVQDAGDDVANGNGDANAPVTGIPKKPTISRNSGVKMTSDTAGSYHLQTVYDLSAVPAKEARKLTEPMLKTATGITLTVGELPEYSLAGAGIGKRGQKNTNKNVMLVLLSVSAILLLRFAAALLPGRRGAGKTAGQSPEEAYEQLTSDQDEIERRRSRR